MHSPSLKKSNVIYVGVSPMNEQGHAHLVRFISFFSMLSIS